MDAVKVTGVNPKRVMPNLKTILRHLVRRLPKLANQVGDTAALFHLPKPVFPLLKIGRHLWLNVAHHGRRATGVQYEADAESRRPVNVPGSARFS